MILRQFNIVLLVTLHLMGTRSDQVPGELVLGNPCQSQVSCIECLFSPGCGWCNSESLNRGASRCDLSANLIKNGCKEEDIFNPKSTIYQNEENSRSTDPESKTQIFPQKLALKIRPNQPLVFNVTFREVANYPVDLYYLMDLTSSMKEHKEKVAELADNLAASMFNITKSFRLGFGSFIDKIAMPYADMTPSRLMNPCRDYTCSPGYGFRNHLPLNTDITKFVNEVITANLSGNLDNAEGGFDAIMQAIVCKDHVNWNLLSRKIILFATDSIFHYAGDGKLGGIVKPNDGLCHLDASGFYTESVSQDYPSLSQINSKVTSNSVNLIFAVPEDRVPLYKILSSFIEGSYTGKLTDDSSNIVHLIRDQYEKIRSEVVLKDDSKGPISVKYSSRCLGKTMEQRNNCSGLQVGDVVNFEVKVLIPSCPKDPKEWKQTINISPVGLAEQVNLDLELLCACDCELEQETKSSKCNQNGNYSCGLCNCNPNHFGSHCECAMDDAIRDDLFQHCKKDGISKICSGRGDCVCGKCDCYSDLKGFYGEFCECDTSSCERDSEGLVCGGPDRGKCCGECSCQEGWTGAACDCTTDISNCIAPEDQPAIGGSGRVCSGHGACKCGQCDCVADERGRHNGPYCEDCSTCEGLCSKFKTCVECQCFSLAETRPQDCGGNCSFKSFVVDSLIDSANERNCLFKDDMECTFEFQYSYDSTNHAVVRVKRDKDCPKTENLMWIGIGLGSAVFVIGLIAVLVVRLIMYLKDKKDYKRFMEEVSNVQWDATATNNPLFKEATTKFQNPIFTPTIKEF